jgi:ABC-2 type transport system ATP-binding protein
MSWSIDDVTVAFGAHVALHGVALTIEPGRVHAVIGGDGAGKSTLLRVLAGLVVSRSGTHDLPPRRHVGFVPAAGGVFGDLSVDENIEFVADAHRLADWRERAEMLLDSAGLTSFGDRLAGRLSGGQRRKLAGSMALLPQPGLLLLDEVTTGVDPVSRMELWRLIASAAAAGTAVVAATTYLDEAERAGSVLLLDQGHVLASGDPRSIVAGIPGSVSEGDRPTDRSTAWRRGRRWRQWDPVGQAGNGHDTTLEDAAIVYELAARSPRS